MCMCYLLSVICCVCLYLYMCMRMVQIQELQDKVTSVDDAKEFYDPETACCSRLSHIPNQSISVPSPRRIISRDSWLQLATRNSLGTTRHIFEGLLAPDEPSSALFEKSKNLASASCRPMLVDTNRIAERGDVLGKDPQNCAMPTPRFARNFTTWNPPCHADGTYPQNWLTEILRIKSRNCILVNSLTQRASSAGRPIWRPKYEVVQVVRLFHCCGSKKSRWPHKWTILWRRGQLQGMYSLILRCLMRRLRPRWRESSRISTPEGELMWKSRMLKNTTGFFEADRLLQWSPNISELLALMKLLWSFPWSFRSIYCLLKGRWHSGYFDTRWDQAPLSASEKTKEKCLGKFVQDENTWICSASDRISCVWTSSRSRSSNAKLSKIDNGKKIHWPIRTRKLRARNERIETGGIGQKEKKVSVGRMMGECYQWKANGQFSHGNSRGQPAQSSSLALKRRRNRLTERRPSTEKSPGEVVFLERKVKERTKNTIKEVVRIRRVIVGILPYVKITNLNRNANSATSASSDILRLTDSPVKSRRKVVEKDQWPCEGSQTHLGCVFQDTEPPQSKSIFTEEHGIFGIRSHGQILQRHIAPVKIGERRYPSQGVIQKCEPQERSAKIWG